MYGYGTPPRSGRDPRSDSPGAVWCLDPDGLPVFSHDRLPDLPFPGKIILGRRHISINDWVFYYHPMYKGTLQWLQRTLIRWKMANPTPEMHELLDEVVEQFQRRLLGEG